MKHSNPPSIFAWILLWAVASPYAETTLRQAVPKHWLIGVSIHHAGEALSKYGHFVKTQFNSLTPANEIKPQSILDSTGNYTFTHADSSVAAAERLGLKVIGHTLLWHHATPSYLHTAKDGKPLPREIALANMRNHIKTVVGRYRGRIHGWDVVNEGLADGKKDTLRDTPWRSAIGDDYIAEAFRAAHEADPDVELYYNDYNMGIEHKRRRAIALILDLRRQGLRVDAVGMQGHVGLNWLSKPRYDPDSIVGRPTPEEFERALKEFAEAGIPVAVTEMDVNVLPTVFSGADVSLRARQDPAWNPFPDSCPQAVLELQANYYAALFRALLKHKDNVRRVTFWGLHDGQTWLNNWPMEGRVNYPLLFDKELRPKQAYHAVMEVLTGSPTVSPGKSTPSAW